jgi:hypothetical protein
MVGDQAVGTDSGATPTASLTLDFSRALLELTVRENGDAMNTLSRVFSEFARLFADVEQRCHKMRQSMPDDAELSSVISDCAAATVALAEGLRAMQLHDITDQRLSHVATLLSALADDRQCDIAQVLTDNEAMELLRMIQSGVPSQEASARLGVKCAARGSVELF